MDYYRSDWEWWRLVSIHLFGVYSVIPMHIFCVCGSDASVNNCLWKSMFESCTNTPGFCWFSDYHCAISAAFEWILLLMDTVQRRLFVCPVLIENIFSSMHILLCHVVRMMQLVGNIAWTFTDMFSWSRIVKTCVLKNHTQLFVTICWNENNLKCVFRTIIAICTCTSLSPKWL